MAQKLMEKENSHNTFWVVFNYNLAFFKKYHSRRELEQIDK